VPNERIPASFNVGLSFAVWAGLCGLLYRASHSRSLLELGCAALAFSFLANTCFSLLHESVHGVFHPNARVNDLFGAVSAAFFPTGFHFQRACHLGHHARNRTAFETFDYIYPGDSRALKTLEWYGILAPSYWLTVILGWILFGLAPGMLRLGARFASRSAAAEHTAGPAYARGLEAVSPVRARLELAFTVALQATLWLALGLSLRGWLACYLAFAVNWSALQYADHAFSPLDVRRGAWDLRVPRLWRWIFLNYHLHRAHHMNPRVPWLHLPRHVDETVPRPSFFAQYLAMWRGPRRAPGPPAREVVVE